MNILFASSECAPYSKSGGLADVAFSLPPALKAEGDEIAIVTPLYQCVRDRFSDQIGYFGSNTVQVGPRKFNFDIFKGELDGVTVWFISNDEMFDRPKLYGYYDDPVRFAFFSKAIISTLGSLSFLPDILHCNDWETALAVIYLKDAQVRDTSLKHVKSVFTIHNIAYQGQYGRDMMESLGLDPGWYDGGLAYIYEGREDINLMKCAMLMADAVSTVSPNYARELHYPEYAHGLQGVVDIVDHKMFGILNGINMAHYDSAKDPRLIANFSTKDFIGKALCKHELQRIFGMAEEIEWPLLASVARLVEQKGIELIKQVLPGLMDMGCQLIVFGQGEQQYIDYFNWAKEKWPDQIGFSSDYTEEMASMIFAGADMYLMPSRFEPCGLSQMMAMRYGTVPIVHETGGLKDSVRGYKEFDGIGDGFSFMDYSAKGLYLAVEQAVKIYFGDDEKFTEIRKRCMTKDFSWNKSAIAYQQMYEKIVDIRSEAELSYEEAFENLKRAYIEVDTINKNAHPDVVRSGYHRVFQITMTGRAEGTFYAEFDNGEMRVEPFHYDNADAFIECSYDNLLAMARGEKNTDALFLSGQLKIRGNLSCGYEFRNELSPISELGLKIIEIRKIAEEMDRKRAEEEEKKREKEKAAAKASGREDQSDISLDESGEGTPEELEASRAAERAQLRADLKKAAARVRAKNKLATGKNKFFVDIS